MATTQPRMLNPSTLKSKMSRFLISMEFRARIQLRLKALFRGSTTSPLPTTGTHQLCITNSPLPSNQKRKNGLKWQSLCAKGAIKMWEWIEPRFSKEFATKSDDTNILDQLAHLKMQHDEDILVKFLTLDVSSDQPKGKKQHFQPLMIRASTQNNKCVTSLRNRTPFMKIMSRCNYSSTHFQWTSSWLSTCQILLLQNKHTTLLICNSKLCSQKSKSWK